MRLALLFLSLVSVGVQAMIFARHNWLDAVLFGPTEDVLIFFGLGVVEALIFVLWVSSAVWETRMRAQHQRDAEDAAEIGQSSELADVRGAAFERLVRAYPDRASVVFWVIERFGRPFSFVLGCVLLISAGLLFLILGGS